MAMSYVTCILVFRIPSSVTAIGSGSDLDSRVISRLGFELDVDLLKSRH